MSKRMQDITPEHYVYVKDTEITANEWQGQRTTGNRKETGPNQYKRFTRIHSTIHPFIQQEEIWKIAGMKRMGPWDKSNGRCFKGIECQDLCDNSQREQSTKSMAGWTTQGKINYRIKFTIYSTMFLHSKERQITIISTELQENKPAYNKEQDITTLN